MKAMVLNEIGRPLALTQLPDPSPGNGEILVEIEACGVCRTDLHVIDGELPNPKLPLVPGHEIVGVVRAVGTGVSTTKIGSRVGVPWLGHTCGSCAFCLAQQENLCDRPQFTGYTRDGGYASQAVADVNFAFDLDASRDAVAFAPLMCAGLIGWRCLKKAGDGQRIGLYGFGAAAHIITQIYRWQGREVYAFSRPGDVVAQRFASDLGATWSGGSDELPPAKLDAAVIFAPVGNLVPAALRAIRKGGRVVCGGIHMSDIPSFPYSILWEERSILSVANLTRADGEEFISIARQANVSTHTTAYPLAEANTALADLRSGRLSGAAVLVP